MRAQILSPTSKSTVKTELSKTSTAAHKESQPFKLFILPKHTSSAARFLFLKHPTDGSNKRFYFCPSSGLFELKKVNAPTTDLRSILFTGPNEEFVTHITEPQNLTMPKNEEQVNGILNQPAVTVDVASGYIHQGAELFVATPFDIVFILISLLSSHGLPAKTPAGKALFQPIDDILDSYLDDDKHLRYILEKGRPMLESAAEKICDTVEGGDEKMYRLNKDMLFRTILDKAQNAVERGLPASLEERYVKRALEKPMLSIKREESSSFGTTEAASEDGLGGTFGTGDSKCSTVASVVSAMNSTVSSATTIVHDEDEAIPDTIINLQRLRTAWLFVTSSYLSKQLAGSLTGFLTSEQCPVDFVPLEKYLSRLAILRAEALTSRSLSGLGQKRGLDDGDASEARAEKKRKQEEDEKRRKAGESRGVRDLKKVDVSGMKKMSAFFTKTSTTKVKS
jgi:hypothetical protein